MHESLVWERPRSFRVPPVVASAKKRFMHESFFGTSEKGKDSCMNL